MTRTDFNASRRDRIEGELPSAADRGDPRTKDSLRPITEGIHQRWLAIRKAELQPMQFSMGHGLILITLAAIVLAGVRGCVSSSNPEAELALAIEASGGRVVWQNSRLFGGPRIVAVDLNGRRGDQELLQQITKLPQLRELYLLNCMFTDRELLSVTAPTNLVRIQLSGNPITDAVVQGWVAGPHLESVDLSGCPITDQAVKALTACPKLWSLRLNDTTITDKSLFHLSVCQRLTVLELRNTPVTDEGVACLSNLGRLRQLDLKGTRVTEQGVERLNAVLTNQPATH